MKSKVTTEPAVEPVTLAEVKASLNITGSNNDTLLTQLIIDAREYAEDYTGRKFITQTLTSYSDGLEGGLSEEWQPGYRVGYEVNSYSVNQKIKFDWVPAQSITSVITVDTDNAETTYASTNYYLDNYDNDLFPFVNVNDNSTLINTSLRSRNSIKVTWVAGYGDAGSDVPASIRRGIIMMASHLYTNRGDCGDECVNKSGANAYISKYRMLSV